MLKGKVSFIKELAGGLLPTRTEQEIRDHESWYQEYMQLNDRKKQVIQRWREKKEVNFYPVSVSLVGSHSLSHFHCFICLFIHKYLFKPPGFCV